MRKVAADLINLARSGYPTAVEITNKQIFDDFYQYLNIKITRSVRRLEKNGEFRSKFRNFIPMLNQIFEIQRILYHIPR